MAPFQIRLRTRIMRSTTNTHRDTLSLSLSDTLTQTNSLSHMHIYMRAHSLTLTHSHTHTRKHAHLLRTLSWPMLNLSIFRFFFDVVHCVKRRLINEEAWQERLVVLRGVMANLTHPGQEELAKLTVTNNTLACGPVTKHTYTRAHTHTHTHTHTQKITRMHTHTHTHRYMHT